MRVKFGEAVNIYRGCHAMGPMTSAEKNIEQG